MSSTCKTDCWTSFINSFASTFISTTMQNNEKQIASPHDCLAVSAILPLQFKMPPRLNNEK